MRQKKIFIFLISFAPIFSIHAQKYVSDSLLVKFGSSEVKKIECLVDTFYDLRKLKPNCISLTEKVKFSIPIDYSIVTPKPVSAEIKAMFSQASDSLPLKTYSFDLKEFEINEQSQPFTSNFNLHALVSVYTITTEKKRNYIGTLIYENQYTLRRDKKNPGKGYIETLDYWKSWFASDMNSILLRSAVDSAFSLSNLRREPSDFRKNMIVSAEVAIGVGVWLVDGEILFSRPEANQMFYRQGNIMRYRHERKYESLETCITNNQVYYRLNKNFVVSNKSKLFFGLNHWNNNEYSKRGFQDVFLLDVSVNQLITYNPFYKRGIICGVGIMEDATYIYSERFKFFPMVVIQVGFKF